MRKFNYVLYCLLSIFFAPQLWAGAYYSVTPSDTADLMVKLDSLESGDTLCIRAGTYDITDASGLVLANKSNVVIMGDGMDATILDFNENKGFYIAAAEFVEIEHLRIQNVAQEPGIKLIGYLSIEDIGYSFSAPSSVSLDYVKVQDCDISTSGAAVYVDDNSSLSYVGNSVFENNTASSNGGAIYVDVLGASLTIENTTFVDNEAANGAAIYIGESSSALSIERCVIRNNTSSNHGSGLYMADIAGSVNLENNAIYANSGSYAVYLQAASGGEASSILLKNNSIALNEYGGLDLQSAFTALTLENNIITDNDENAYYDVYASSSLSLSGSYNVVNDLSNVTLSTSQNTLNLGFDVLTIDNDSLIHTKDIIPYIIGTLAAGSYPTYDLYGERDAFRSDPGAIEVNSDTIAFWTGGAGTHDWSDSANWKDHSKPEVDGAAISPYTDIYLTYCDTTNYPLISSSIDLSNKGRYDNADVLVGSSAIFVNEGEIQVKSIKVESDASANVGQYITTGAITVTGTQEYEQTLKAGQWNFLCVPEDISADNLLPSYTFGGSWSSSSATGDYWISYYDADSRADNGLSDNWEQITSGSEVLEAGRGYLVWVDEALTVVFDYVPGDMDLALAFEEGAADSTHWGWNFIGNPYTIALESDKIIANATNADNTIGGIYWHNGSNYVSRTADGVGDAAYIPAHQGFFVQAVEASSYQLKPTNAVFRTDVSFKSVSSARRDVMKINMTDELGHTSNTYLQISDWASDRFDHYYDAYELSDYSNAKALIYSHMGGIDYSVNAVSYEPDMVKSIPLVLTLSEGSSSFSLNFDLDGFTDVEVYFYDELNDERIRINNGDVLDIPISATVTSYAERYAIEFHTEAEVTGTYELEADDQTFFTLNNKQRYFEVSSADKEKPIFVFVYDLQGKQMLQRSLTGGYGTVPASDAGIYLIKMVQGDKVETHQVFVR